MGSVFSWMKIHVVFNFIKSGISSLQLDYVLIHRTPPLEQQQLPITLVPPLESELSVLTGTFFEQL